MRDRGPYPVLALMGEQGSAKTSFATILRSLVDPNTAALRSFPREDRDLFIAASNGWIVGYDNVSRIPSWLSDALCRLATGGGFSTRKLYTDDEEQLFNAQRPVVLNGIEDFVNRPDLADRTTFLTLDPIPEDRRKADQALQSELERMRPQILGALLNLMVVGLQRLPRTKLARLPRMADFALWGTACERQPGGFMRAYEGNRAAAVEIVLEADLVATAVLALMKRREGQEWVGTSTTLLSALTEMVDENQRRDKDWPKRANALSGRLRRAATNLRKAGIGITDDRSGRQRTIRISLLPTQPDREGKRSSSSSQPAANGKNASAQKDLAGDDVGDDGVTMGDDGGSMIVTATPLKTNGNDDGDDRDDDLHTQSGADEPVCCRCGVGASEHYGPLTEHRGELYHRRCWADEEKRPRYVPPDHRPALGPEGDSLDDLV
jgi:hypothetical protein